MYIDCIQRTLPGSLHKFRAPRSRLRAYGRKCITCEARYNFAFGDIQLPFVGLNIFEWTLPCYDINW